ncbi:MAG: bifunctional phosphoglucose/phosphomannose isomerase [Candidatus Woesearchaeota archaeon]
MPGLYDKHNMLGVINSLPDQIKEAYQLGKNIQLKNTPNQIFVCGMGGSSISGQLIEAYFRMLKIKIPVYNIQDYNLPEYTDRNSLIFIISYSGNTEESISCYREALKKSLNIIILTSGGKLEEYARINRLSCVLIPKGYQPRNAVAYLFFPMLRILENARIINDNSEDVKNLIENLRGNQSSFDRIGYDIALKLFGKLPIIYASNNLYSIAYRWKCEINENTKIPAFCHKFPELNHNELNGYVNYNKINIPMHAIILQDQDDHRRTIKRMEVTRKLVKEITNDSMKFTEITIRGDSILTKIFTTIYIGDLVSYHLAMNYATDPTPVDLIEKFKKEMGPYI